MKHLDYSENTEVLHIGTLEPHCYFIPFAPGSNPYERREKSERFELLNGDWDFAFFPFADEVPDDLSSVTFSEVISIPSNWQLKGYGQPWYSNTRYIIPFDPPYVPEENAAGVYHRKILYDPDGNRKILVFEGVDSCLYLYVNNVFCGYSQVSHCTSEFDITDLLHTGENDITVTVLRFCDGTYLEDQDKWRMSGIFRDVYILSRPVRRIQDYHIETHLYPEDNGSAEVTLRLYGTADADVTLEDPDGTVLFSGRAVCGKTLAIAVDKPVLWNAEAPELYHLILDTGDELIGERIGIREVRIENGIFRINGVPVKLRGVNRHDSYPDTGFYCSYERMREDLLIMKRHNVNALRCAHYPNAPLLYGLMDELGFYVIDEADVEAHGCVDVHSPSRTEHVPVGEYKYIAMLASDQRFRKPILDRANLLVARDRNRPCVVIWSLGNESGYGTNFRASAQQISNADPTRPIHYESVLKLDDTSDAVLDFQSFMYPSVTFLRELLEKGEDRRPVLLCEYSHAMGLGPGDLKDYWDLFYAEPRCMGGLIWEFRDHGILFGSDGSGKPMYKYGGDFGEPYHDGIFCIDALCFPDGTPHTGFKEAKNIFRPVYARLLNQKSGLFSFTSRLDFISTAEILSCRYTLENAGKEILTGVLDLTLNAKETKELNIPELAGCEGDDLAVTFRYLQKNNTAWAAAGSELGFDQIRLNHSVIHTLPQPLSGAVLKEDKEGFLIVAGNVEYRISRRTALPVSVKENGKEILNRPVEFNLFRAPICNDRDLEPIWKDVRLSSLKPKVYSICGRNDTGGSPVIEAELSLSGGIVQPVARIHLRLKFGSNGMFISAETKLFYDFPFMPRFGLRFSFKKELRQVTYLGYGPEESYIDMHRSARYGRFTSDVSGMHTDYIYPQENGSHWGTTLLEVEGGGAALRFTSAADFSFSVSEYTQEELTEKKHNWELHKCDSTVLCVDYAMSGVGSGACGPQLASDYALTDKNFRYDLRIEVL